jgi:hypothetical protein
LSSDPICSSAGCWKSVWAKKEEDKVVQYPSFEETGLDHDIKVSLNNTQNSETKLSHKFELKGDAWINNNNGKIKKEVRLFIWTD